MISVEQQNAIDEGVAELRRVIDGMEIETYDQGPFVILSADDLPREAVERVLLKTSRRFCEQLVAQPEPKARATDKRTSHQAAASNSRIRKGQQEKIFAYLAEHPHRCDTAETIATVTFLRLNSVSTRMTELVRAGWVDCFDQGGRRNCYKVSTRGLLHYRLGRAA